MGHYCWVCQRVRANERFSGKGHARHVCKECMRRPKEERKAIVGEGDAIGFLSQSNISEKNIDRLRELAESPRQETAEVARLVLELALVKPRRKKRMRFLERERPDLMERLEAAGMIEYAVGDGAWADSIERRLREGPPEASERGRSFRSGRGERVDDVEDLSEQGRRE